MLHAYYGPCKQSTATDLKADFEPFPQEPVQTRSPQNLAEASWYLEPLPEELLPTGGAQKLAEVSEYLEPLPQEPLPQELLQAGGSQKLAESSEYLNQEPSPEAIGLAPSEDARPCETKISKEPASFNQGSTQYRA
jgi:hypothetical protein